MLQNIIFLGNIDLAVVTNVNYESYIYRINQYEITSYLSADPLLCLKYVYDKLIDNKL